jgi:hypothetical protein
LTIRSLAEKNLFKHVQESARQQWLEMGVLSVTFTAYTAPNGLMVVDASVADSPTADVLLMLLPIQS